MSSSLASSSTAGPAPSKDVAAAEAAYLASCKELASSINSLESSLASFIGSKEGVQGEVFAHTRARLNAELAGGGGSHSAAREQ